METMTIGMPTAPRAACAPVSVARLLGAAVPTAPVVAPAALPPVTGAPQLPRAHRARIQAGSGWTGLAAGAGSARSTADAGYGTSGSMDVDIPVNKPFRGVVRGVPPRGRPV